MKVHHLLLAANPPAGPGSRRWPDAILRNLPGDLRTPPRRSAKPSERHPREWGRGGCCSESLMNSHRLNVLIAAPVVDVRDKYRPNPEGLAHTRANIGGGVSNVKANSILLMEITLGGLR